MTSNMIRRMKRFLALGAVGGTAMLMGSSAGCNEAVNAFADGFTKGFEATSGVAESAAANDWSGSEDDSYAGAGWLDWL